jgi:hypothetical protein
MHESQAKEGGAILKFLTFQGCLSSHRDGTWWFGPDSGMFHRSPRSTHMHTVGLDRVGTRNRGLQVRPKLGLNRRMLILNGQTRVDEAGFRIPWPIIFTGNGSY